MRDLGQFIITGISGKELTSSERDFLAKENIGGIILFSKNYADPLQLKKLTDDLNSINKTYPLIISVDNEGGRVFRFKKDFTHFPNMLSLGELDDPEVFYKIGKIMGQELISCGVNLNFSPCCDLFTNPENEVIGDRAFGRTPNQAIPKIIKYIKGIRESGVLSCAKHFPGHGDTKEDSHFELPRVSTPLKDLKAREFLPFISAIEADVDTAMMGHLLVDEIDQRYPCTLSPRAYEILKNDLGFKGLIFTDDMQMEAVKNIEKAAVLSLKAGANCLIYRDLEYAKEALLSLRACKESFEDSLANIIHFKKKRINKKKVPEISFAEGRKLLEEIKTRMV